MLAIKMGMHHGPGWMRHDKFHFGLVGSECFVHEVSGRGSPGGSWIMHGPECKGEGQARWVRPGSCASR